MTSPNVASTSRETPQFAQNPEKTDDFSSPSSASSHSLSSDEIATPSDTGHPVIPAMFDNLVPFVLKSRQAIRNLPQVIIEVRCATSPQGPAMEITSHLDSGAAEQIYPTDGVRDLINRCIIPADALVSLPKPINFGCADGGQITCCHMVTLSLLTPDNIYATLEFLTCCAVSKPYIGWRGMFALGYLRAFSLYRTPGQPRPTHFSDEVAYKASAADYREASADTTLLANLSDRGPVSSQPLLQAILAPPASSATDSFSALTIVPNPSDSSRFQIMVRFPILENVLVQPTAAKPRQTNNNTRWIQKMLIESKIAEGHYSEVTPANIQLSHPIVLVKKAADKNLRIDYSLPECRARALKDYRLTLDCNTMNTLRLVQDNNGQVVLLPVHLIHNARRVIRPVQQQPSGLIVAREMPHGMNSYASDDAVSAFGQVLLAPAMQKLFGFSFRDPETNQTRYFVCTRLPQGFELSSAAFRTVSEFLVHEMIQLPEIADLIKNGTLYLANNVDDFLAAAVNNDICLQGRAAIRKILARYSLPISVDKAKGPSSHLIFSGLEFGPNSTCKPHPNRKPITDAFYTSFMQTLETDAKNRPRALKLLRSAAGTFQYNRSFGTMLGEHAVLLQKLYDVITAMQNDEKYVISAEDKKQVKEAVYVLTDYCVNGCPSILLSQPDHSKVVASIILCDANKPSYSGGLFWIYRVEEKFHGDDISTTPEFQLLIDKLREELGPDMPPYVRVLPVQFTGGLWRTKTDAARSSTYRERIAHIYVHADVYPYLAGPVYVVCDGANTTVRLPQPELHLSGPLLNLYDFMMSSITGFLWMPRETLPALPDLCARSLEQFDVVQPALPQFAAISATSPAFDAESSSLAIPAPDLNGKLISELLSGYVSDEVSSYHSVSMYSIWRHFYETSSLIGQVPQDPDESARTARGRSSPIASSHFKKFKRSLTAFAIGPFGLLYNISTPSQPRIYVPDSLSESLSLDGTPVNIRNILMLTAHVQDIKHAAATPHAGYHRTLKKLSQRFWWPRVDQDVARFIFACHRCARGKQTEKQTLDHLSSIGATVPHLFHTWEIDYAGPFRLLDSASPVYVALMRECKGGFLICRIVIALTAEIYIDLLRHHILPLGAQRIHTDRGRNFHSRLAREFGEEHRIRMTFGLSYYHQIQALVERTIVDLRRALDTALPHGQLAADFSRVLQEFVQQHNTSPHSRTGVSPYQYTFQWDHPDSIKQLLSTVQDPEEVQDYRSRHDKFIAQAYLEQAATYKAKARPSHLAVGHVVYRMYRENNAKTVRSGPHTVLRQLGGNVWEISPEPDAKRSENLQVPANFLRVVVDAPDLWAGIDDAIRTISNQF